MKIVLNHLHVQRGAWSLVAHGTFEEGIHLVSGAVGSGKSTLALAMAGLLTPVRGTVEREDTKSLMLSTQFPEFHITGLSVADECGSWGLDFKTVIRSAKLEIDGDASPLTLSRGELKRLHLACVLARQYDLLLLDEPFSSLDCTEKERLCRELSGRDSGITIIFTHEQSIFPRVDQLWEITGGELCALGRTPESLTRWQHAPVLVKKLIAAGRCPRNLTPGDIREAACRTHE
ncbi:MAG: ATP-binding cassette domain-containing protein [Methanoregula sp.]|nr:ATP-binding cassette domain-containing protein [Methanoregula sp.]